MTKLLSGEELRQWAQKCLAQAEATNSDVERHRLKKMHEGLMEMASTQDWLDGWLLPKTPAVPSMLQ